MGTKLNLDEEFIVNEYLNGKSSLVLEKELGISKPVILEILNKHQVVKKRDRCKILDIKKIDDKYITYRQCPKCNKDIKVSSNNSSITCRNYYNAVNKKSLCKECGIESQKGEGNPFFGKKHSEESKQKISNSRVGKATGENNSMAKKENRDKVGKSLLDRIKNNPIKYSNRSKDEKQILEKIKLKYKNTIHSHNVEFYICDIYIPDLNLIIEYNGDYWHCNPKKYKPDYYHQVKQLTAKELWEYDKNKIDLIKKSGYNLEIVWEFEYKKNPSIINEILKKYDKN